MFLTDYLARSFQAHQERREARSARVKSITLGGFQSFAFCDATKCISRAIIWISWKGVGGKEE